MILFNSVGVYEFVMYLDDSWFRCVYCVICLLAGDIWAFAGLCLYFYGFCCCLVVFIAAFLMWLICCVWWCDCCVDVYVCYCSVVCFITCLVGWFCKLAWLIGFAL